MQIGDSYLVSPRRIDRIVDLIEGSDLLLIDVYTKFKEFPFTYENREHSQRSHYISMKPMTDLEMKAQNYFPDVDSWESSEKLNEFISDATASESYMPEFRDLMTKTFVKPDVKENDNTPLIVGALCVGGILLLAFN